jgi:hypothetical protein
VSRFTMAMVAIRFLHTTYLLAGIVELPRKTAPLPQRFGRVAEKFGVSARVPAGTAGMDVKEDAASRVTLRGVNI